VYFADLQKKIELRDKMFFADFSESGVFFVENQKSGLFERILKNRFFGNEQKKIRFL